MEGQGMKFELNMKDKSHPLSPDASKPEIMCWIISNQQSQIQWWRAAAVAAIITLVVYVITGKLITGTFVP